MTTLLEHNILMEVHLCELGLSIERGRIVLAIIYPTNNKNNKNKRLQRQRKSEK